MRRRIRSRKPTPMDKAAHPTRSSDDIRLPLIVNNKAVSETKTKTPAKKAVRKAFKGTANLANLLPSGTVLIFHVLAPIFTNAGKCDNGATRTMAIILLAACALLCFCLCFTDSFRDEKGKVRYGVATFNGLRVIDGSGVAPPPEEAVKFRIRVVDFFHACMSVVVFAAVAMSDQNVIHCFLPAPPSPIVKKIVMVGPSHVGMLCSALFVIFPTTRHGIGFPVSCR